jgi:hypothetical protein
MKVVMKKLERSDGKGGRIFDNEGQLSVNKPLVTFWLYLTKGNTVNFLLL